MSSERKLFFLLKLTLYTLPFALAFLLLSGFMVYTGEAMPLEIVARLQMGDQPILFRPRYGARDLDFKTISANLRQPEILAVGSSRLLQFRSMFFNRQPRAFYNAAAPAWELAQVQQFLAGLSFTPRILILNLDQPIFNDAWVKPYDAPQVSDFANLFQVNRSFMQEVFSGVISKEGFDFGRYLARIEPGLGGTALGLRAIRDGHGFRNDGSEQYGDFLVAHWLDPQAERQRHLDLVRDGGEMYVYGDTVSAARLQQLDDVLRWCDQRGITVIGFLPSFMPTLYQQIMTDGNHSYLQKLDAALAPIFERYGFAYFNFSDGATLGATDDDFFDGWHASERINLRLYSQMRAALPDLLGDYSDPAFLAAADASSTDTFNLFGNQF
ncbi:MAG: hypothetical protein ABI835_15320 [Chloroflexota bacterium]